MNQLVFINLLFCVDPKPQRLVPLLDTTIDTLHKVISEKIFSALV